MQQDGALESEYEGVNAGKDFLCLLIFGIRCTERIIVTRFFQMVFLDCGVISVINIIVSQLFHKILINSRVNYLKQNSIFIDKYFAFTDTMFVVVTH